MIHSDLQSLFLFSRASLVVNPPPHVNLRGVMSHVLRSTNVIVFSLGLCFSRHIMYMELIVSCTLLLRPTLLSAPLLFLFSYLSEHGYASLASFEIMYSKIKGDLYQISRSCPSITNPSLSCSLFLSLFDSLSVSRESETNNIFWSYNFLLTLLHWGVICYHAKMIIQPFLPRLFEIHHVGLILP